ncbi:MAG: hypothetical protein L3J68_04330 [Thermoplasmata archaeon]|nr:hypothetical protein [Thermoplasmata archaeon]
MSDQVSASVHARSAESRGATSDPSRRYLLPIAGAISITLGLALTVVAKFPGDVYLSLLLVGLGVGGLASALAASDARETLPVVASAPSERFIADTLVICPSCSARSFGPVSTPAPSSATWRVPDLPRDTVVAGPSHAIASTAGDFLWETWASETGRLPVGLIGPVAETAYVAPRPGAPALHEEGEPELAEWLASSIPAPETRDSTSLLSAARGAVASGPQVEDAESTLVMGMSDWKSVGSAVLEYTSADVVLWEAMNPTPPHLRAPSRPRASPSPISRPPRSQAIPSGQCADCAELVPDPANWRRCLECGHLLCSVCMVDALVSRERPWCSRCAEARHLITR